MSSSDPSPNAETYLQLLNENEKSLAAYVHALVVDAGDAEDILQACRLTLWKQFETFEPGTNFLAWARKIALNQVLNYRRSRKRKPLYSTDPALLEAVAAEIDKQSDQLAKRTEALHTCLQKLPEKQRSTVLLRYFEGSEIDEIASRTNRSPGAVYRLLSRIRSSLNQCIQQQMEVAP